MPTYPSPIPWSLAIALLTLVGCGHAPQVAPGIPGTITQAHEATLDLKNPGGGHLMLRPPTIASRKLMAVPEQIDCFKVDLVRCKNGEETVVVRAMELPAHGNATMVSVLNLLPGEYRMDIVALDKDGYELQKVGPTGGPHQSETFEIRAYEVTTVNVLVPLRDTIVTFIAPPEQPKASSGGGSGRSSAASLTSSEPQELQTDTTDTEGDALPTDGESPAADGSPSPTAEDAPQAEASPDAGEPSPTPTPSVDPSPTPSPEATAQPEQTSSGETAALSSVEPGDQEKEGHS